MKKFKLTTNGKIFFGILAFVTIIIIFASYQKFPMQRPMTTIYCIPDCTPKQVNVGVTTLVKGCYINQTECQTASQQAVTPLPNDGTILIGFKDSVHNVPRVGSVTMLNLNVTKVYVRESNQTDWVPVFDGSKTFDVAALTNQSVFIASTKIPIREYTQEKVVLGIGTIKVFYPLYGLYGRINYSLYPATNETIVAYSFSPTSDATIVLVFDLDVENSVTHSTDGYFLTPQFTVASSTVPNGQLPADSIFIS